MSWRQNMEIGIENINSIPKSNIRNKSDIHKSQEKEPIKTNIADIALRVQKVKTPEIIIKKMSICLHGKPCKNISLVDFRQICLKNNQPIFDMAACPDGRWKRSQDRPQKKTMTCGGKRTTLADGRYARYVIIEWLQ